MPSRKDRLKRRFDREVDFEGDRGRELEGEAVDRIRGFDPQESVRRSSRAAFDEFSEDFKRDVGDLRSSQVGVGRLRTGFANEDEDRLFQESSDRLNRFIAQRAMEGAGMELRNNALFGGFAERGRNRSLDLLSGGLDREQAEENARRQRRGGLLGALGAGVGLLAGGPVGAGVGGLLGEQIGNFFG